MTDNTIDKIRTAEQGAIDIIANAKKERTEAITATKKSWDSQVDVVRKESEGVIAGKVATARSEADSIKSNRETEIKGKMKDIIENAKGSVEEAVDFVVKKTLEL